MSTKRCNLSNDGMEMAREAQKNLTSLLQIYAWSVLCMLTRVGMK